MLLRRIPNARKLVLCSVLVVEIASLAYNELHQSSTLGKLTTYSIDSLTRGITICNFRKLPLAL